MDVKNTQGQSQRENIPFSISPTWQRLAYQTSPVSVRAPEVATMPKNTHTKKNKLFAMAAVPMGTDLQKVFLCRRSSTQTVMLKSVAAPHRADPTSISQTYSPEKAERASYRTLCK